MAAHAALDLLATHADGYDAAVIAMSFDAGVVAARRLVGIPVLGITEAALHTACLLGRRFGMIVAGAVSVPLYLDLIDASGVRGRLVGLEVAEIGSVEAYLDRRRAGSGRSAPRRTASPTARRPRPSCCAVPPSPGWRTACSPGSVCH